MPTKPKSEPRLVTYELWVTISDNSPYKDGRRLAELNAYLRRKTRKKASATVVNGQVTPERNGKYLFRVSFVPEGDPVVREASTILRSRSLKVDEPKLAR